MQIRTLSRVICRNAVYQREPMNSHGVTFDMRADCRLFGLRSTRAPDIGGYGNTARRPGRYGFGPLPLGPRRLGGNESMRPKTMDRRGLTSQIALSGNAEYGTSVAYQLSGSDQRDPLAPW